MVARVVDVPVTFQADIAAATEVIRVETDHVWHDPAFASVILAEPTVLGTESLEPGRVVIRIVVRTRPQEQWRVERELRTRIKAALDQAGIALPSASRGPRRFAPGACGSCSIVGEQGHGSQRRRVPAPRTLASRLRGDGRHRRRHPHLHLLAGC